MTATLTNLNALAKEINFTQEVIMGSFELHIDHFKSGRFISEVPDTAELNKMYAQRKEMVQELRDMGVDNDQIMAAAKGKLNN
ncbi:hypothetical protein [Corynebacterium phoceense]|uniref:hypothetical protein n=1 Tax=Corynebacterium phoceense TaxID=1686286 RepID=UPI0018ABD7E4|nr:hypothetical protein [Corynebacterium phoceense]MBF9011336.1 hypothetical protein [Corynebacterium phoceense]